MKLWPFKKRAPRLTTVDERVKALTDEVERLRVRIEGKRQDYLTSMYWAAITGGTGREGTPREGTPLEKRLDDIEHVLLCKSCKGSKAHACKPCGGRGLKR